MRRQRPQGRKGEKVKNLHHLKALLIKVIRIIRLLIGATSAPLRIISSKKGANPTQSSANPAPGSANLAPLSSANPAPIDNSIREHLDNNREKGCLNKNKIEFSPTERKSLKIQHSGGTERNNNLFGRAFEKIRRIHNTNTYNPMGLVG